MAQTWVKFVFSLIDYFDRYGFDEGNDSNIGDSYIKLAVEVLNKHLEPHGLIVIDASKKNFSHNSCRIIFENSEFSDIDQESLEDQIGWEERLNREDKALKRDGRISHVNEEANAELAEKIVKAIVAAETEFDNRAQDDMSRVMNVADKDLPLLVGHIEDEDAKKILEWRLKGATV
jgi:hypothetical protein